MNNIEKIKRLIIDKPLKLDCGQTISNFPLAYETYGTLNDKKDNGQNYNGYESIYSDPPRYSR